MLLKMVHQRQFRSPNYTCKFIDEVCYFSVVAAEPRFASVWADYYSARVFSLGWSVDLGWGGVVLCVMASILWILLSKIMRYNPRTTASLLS